jgi:hypothetical protein
MNEQRQDVTVEQSVDSLKFQIVETLLEFLLLFSSGPVYDSCLTKRAVLRTWDRAEEYYVEGRDAAGKSWGVFIKPLSHDQVQIRFRGTPREDGTCVVVDNAADGLRQLKSYLRDYLVVR